MPDFTKLAVYLDSFSKEDPNYDFAAFIKAKIADDLQDTNTVNNGGDEALDDNDVTMSTSQHLTHDNYEGGLMHSAFQELEVLNNLQEEKDEVHRPDVKDRDGKTRLDVATEEAFGDNIQNQKHATLYDVLRNKLKK